MGQESPHVQNIDFLKFFWTRFDPSCSRQYSGSLLWHVRGTLIIIRWGGVALVLLLVISSTVRIMEVVQNTILLIFTVVVSTLTALFVAGIILDFMAIK